MELKVRHNITQKAAELFFQFGPSKVTMDEIAEQLGMSKKTLYKFFNGKDELLEAVVEDFQCQLMCIVDPVLESLSSKNTEEFTTILSGLGEAIALQINRHAGSPLFKDLQRNYPAIWKLLEQRRREHIIYGFESILQEGIVRGIFRDDLDYTVFMELYLCSVEHLLQPAVLSRLPLTGGEVYKMMISIFFGGVFTDKARTIVAPYSFEPRTVQAVVGLQNGERHNTKNGHGATVSNNSFEYDELIEVM